MLAEMANGYANNQIARHLAVSEKGVEKHVTSIFRKLRVPDSKRVDRRVTAVLVYQQAIGELPVPRNRTPSGPRTDAAVGAWGLHPKVRRQSRMRQTRIDAHRDHRLLLHGDRPGR